MVGRACGGGSWRGATDFSIQTECLLSKGSKGGARAGWGQPLVYQGAEEDRQDEAGRGRTLPSCPVSTGGGTRRVQLVRGGGGGRGRTLPAGRAWRSAVPASSKGPGWGVGGRQGYTVPSGERRHTCSVSRAQCDTACPISTG